MVTRPQLPRRQLYVGGRWVDSRNTTELEVIDPTTGDAICSVATASGADVDAAVRAARTQFDGGPWSTLSGSQRGRLLYRLADLVEANAARLAALEAWEVGKPYADALHVDVPAAVETFRHFAGWADKLAGTTQPVPDFMGRSRLSYTERVPLGVVAAITPWNAPTMIISWKLAPALAAGCTVVLKPAEDAPLNALLMAELVEEAGFPAGVLNVVNGTGAEVGAALCAHPGVDKVSFTGSPQTGRLIGRQCAEAFKHVTLELGGKSPQIVLPGADVEELAPVAALSVFANSGQTCAAGTRVLVHRTLLDEVVTALAEQARAQVLGDPFDPATTMGALVNDRQRSRVLDYVERGHADGAELITGGRAPDRPGFFVEPTVFLGDNAMPIAQEEIFGPVATVVPFDSTDEAIRLANDTKYGLAAVIWSHDMPTVLRVSRQLRVGAVWVNAWGIPDPRLPWGGMKTSGLGRELGLTGLHNNTEERVVNIVY